MYRIKIMFNVKGKDGSFVTSEFICQDWENNDTYFAFEETADPLHFITIPMINILTLDIEEIDEDFDDDKNMEIEGVDHWSLHIPPSPYPLYSTKERER